MNNDALDIIIPYEDMTLLVFLHWICDHQEELSDDQIESYLVAKFDKYIKEIRKYLNENFKIKKKLDDYKYADIAQILFDSKDIENDPEAIDTHIKNSFLGILKVLENTKTDAEWIVKADGSSCINRNLLLARSYYYLSLVIHIQEYFEHVVSYKTKRLNKSIIFRSQLNAQETIYLALRLPRNEIYYNDIAQAPVAAFLLRQSIELKILEILNIRCIWNKKQNKPLKLTADAFLPLIFLGGIRYYKDPFRNKELTVSETLLRKVHAWANPYVHTGNMQYLWEVEVARQAIVDFIMATVDIPEATRMEIPNLALQYVKEEYRDDCEVILRK